MNKSSVGLGLGIGLVLLFALGLTGYKLGSDGTTGLDRTNYAVTPYPTGNYLHLQGGGVLINAMPSPTMTYIAQIRSASTPIMSYQRTGEYHHLSNWYNVNAQSAYWQIGASGHAVVILGDAAGASSLQVQDSALAVQVKADSDGTVWTKGYLNAGPTPTGAVPNAGTIRGTTADFAYLGGTTLHATTLLDTDGNLQVDGFQVVGTSTRTPTAGQVVIQGNLYSDGTTYTKNVDTTGNVDSSGQLRGQTARLSKWIAAGPTPTWTPVDGMVYATFGSFSGVLLGGTAPTPINTATQTPTYTPTATPT